MLRAQSASCSALSVAARFAKQQAARGRGAIQAQARRARMQRSRAMLRAGGRAGGGERARMARVDLRDERALVCRMLVGAVREAGGRSGQGRFEFVRVFFLCQQARARSLAVCVFASRFSSLNCAHSRAWLAMCRRTSRETKSCGIANTKRLFTCASTLILRS